MKITTHTGPWETLSVDALAWPLTTAMQPQRGLDSALAGLWSEIGAEFKGKAGESLALHRPPGEHVRRHVLIGVGKQADAFSLHAFGSQAARIAGKMSAKRLAIIVSDPAQVRRVVEGVLFGDCHLRAVKDGNGSAIEELILCGAVENCDIAAAQIDGDAINYARELITAPANELGPVELADRAAADGRAAGLEVEVFDETALRSMGAGAILAVGQGSVRPPRLVRLSWVPQNAKGSGHLFLIGKGITFDSGGLSLKPADSMEKMKYDMAGAATMLAVMLAAARRRLPVRVSALLALAENMPSGTALRPGDVIAAMNGKTIEVINTDAEGRLVLADALVYATRLGATQIIDAATLTGAVSVALGSVNVAVLSNNDALAGHIRAAGQSVGERFWQLPMDEEYLAPMRGDISDLRNASAERKAGTITAAKFLEQFVSETPWAHLDIAGTAWTDKATAAYPKGATGVAVRTLLRLVEDLA